MLATIGISSSSCKKEFITILAICSPSSKLGSLDLFSSNIRSVRHSAYLGSRIDATSEVVSLYCSLFSIRFEDELSIVFLKNWLQPSITISLEEKHVEIDLHSYRFSAIALDVRRLSIVDLDYARYSQLVLHSNRLSEVIKGRQNLFSSSPADCNDYLDLSSFMSREADAVLSDLSSFRLCEPMAIYFPRWCGVSASTRTLFTQSVSIPADPNIYPEQVSAADITLYSTLISQFRFSTIFFSGGDSYMLDIAMNISKTLPSTSLFLLWHSSFLQLSEDLDRQLLSEWIRLYRKKILSGIAVVKDGLDRYLESVGVRSVYIPNFIPVPDKRADQPSISTEKPVSVGLWLSGSSDYRKIPYTVLLAISLIPNAILYGSGLHGPALEIVYDLQIKCGNVYSDPIDRAVMFRLMKKTDITLYITSSECSPMLPLESFAVGVPCIIGPSCSLFATNDILRRYLVLDSLVSPLEISKRVKDVVDNSSIILDAYSAYSKSVKSQAVEGINTLVQANLEQE